MAYNATGPEANPEINSFFAIELDGFSGIVIEKYSLSDSEHNVLEDRAGVDGPTKRTAAGLKNVQTITIEKRVRPNEIENIEKLIAWHQLGSKDKRAGSLVVLGRDKERLYGLDFKEGWISKWKAPEGDAMADSEPLTHVFEITVPEVTFSR